MKSLKDVDLVIAGELETENLSGSWKRRERIGEWRKDESLIPKVKEPIESSDSIAVAVRQYISRGEREGAIEEARGKRLCAARSDGEGGKGKNIFPIPQISYWAPSIRWSDHLSNHYCVSQEL